METAKPSLKKLGIVKRQAVTSTSAEWIKTEQLSGHPLPLLVTPAIDGLDLINWTQNHQDWLKTQLLKHGGILFRNCHIKDIDGFQEFMDSISAILILKKIKY